MLTIYAICAVVGGVFVLIQFFLALTGLGGDEVGGNDAHDGGAGDHDWGHDADHGAEHEGSHFFNVLSIRSIAAGLAFFGLGGLAANELGVPSAAVLWIALGAGAGALLVVAWIMRFLGQLWSEGNVDIRNAVGSSAIVYLKVPGERRGRGKVTVTLQDRTMEYEAVTGGEELPTGAQAEVVDVVDAHTLEVKRA